MSLRWVYDRSRFIKRFGEHKNVQTPIVLFYLVGWYRCICWYPLDQNRVNGVTKVSKKPTVLKIGEEIYEGVRKERKVGDVYWTSKGMYRGLGTRREGDGYRVFRERTRETEGLFEDSRSSRSRVRSRGVHEVTPKALWRQGCSPTDRNKTVTNETDTEGVIWPYGSSIPGIDPVEPWGFAWCRGLRLLRESSIDNSLVLHPTRTTKDCNLSFVEG